MNRYQVTALAIERSCYNASYYVLAENEEEALEKARCGEYEDEDIGDWIDHEWIDTDFSQSEVTIEEEGVPIESESSNIQSSISTIGEI